MKMVAVHQALTMAAPSDPLQAVPCSVRKRQFLLEPAIRLSSSGLAPKRPNFGHCLD
jgi:hypothetical protein